MMIRRWRRLDLDILLKDVPEGGVDQHATVRWAKQQAAQSGAPVYPSLPYTEANFRWVLLYEHIQRGQIQPHLLRRMRRDDLEYLAGHPLPHPELLSMAGTSEQKADAHGRAVKIVENVARASRELQRRADRRAYLWSTAVAAAIGSAAGVIVAARVTS